MSNVQVPPLVPRKEKKKKQVKDEMDRRKQAEKKRRRLEKALATSAAIRSELEKKKQKKKEEEQRLDEEGAAIAEAVALHVLCDDLDDSCQIMLNKNDGFGLDSLRDCATNIGAFLGGWKTTAPCLSFGKYYLDGFGCASDAYGSGCKWNDWGIGWSFAPGMIDQDIPELYFEEKGQGAELSPGLIAAQAVSSLQIAEDAHCGNYTGEETATVIINGMLEGGCLGSNINLYKAIHISLLVVTGFLVLSSCECRNQLLVESFDYQAMSCRAHSASLEDFGGVGDGVTSNTKAFQRAVAHLGQYESDGGGLLYVPAGRWVTGSFNLTSHFTLYLHRDALILGSQVMSEYPLIDPLPSYGRGRDAPGGRYSSLIMGSNLTDVVITGDNGTIDGQGTLWWDKFKNKELQYTRGYLIEIMFSNQILISNLTLINSTSWNIHPVYSSNVIVKGVTILARIPSPNTDGIDPDSCTNVRIEDCYIVSGDDCISIKSGWDEYGIAFGMPTKHVIIRRLTCISPTSAVIALGSEMSGGIQDVRAEEIVAINSESGVRIKTSPGRGGFVKDIFVKGMTMSTMKWVYWMTGSYGDHPDNNYDPNALPVIQGISYSDMVAENVTMAAKLEGMPGAPFTGICISNVTIGIVNSTKLQWNCTEIQGISSSVSPQPCALLSDRGSETDLHCPYPAERLPIEDVEFKRCYNNSAHL